MRFECCLDRHLLLMRAWRAHDAFLSRMTSLSSSLFSMGLLTPRVNQSLSVHMCIAPSVHASSCCSVCALKLEAVFEVTEVKVVAILDAICASGIGRGEQLWHPIHVCLKYLVCFGHTRVQ